mmetsp:Transcript_70583/g.213660  ORF Transcript_70583/g.213660 Transcript_70583/m.213660 type:complete len:516 (-) Transcript_70583:250-1797(-)
MGRPLFLCAVCLAAQWSSASGGAVHEVEADTCSDPEGCKDTLAGDDGDDPALLQMKAAGSPSPKGAAGKKQPPAVHAAGQSKARRKPSVVHATGQSKSNARAGAASKQQCAGVSKILAGGKGLRRARQLWGYACGHERSQIPDLSSGCLYVPSDASVRELLSYVEHPNPAVFAGMFTKALFGAVGGTKCPSELPGKELTSKGGMKVVGCKGGFLGMDGDCIQAALIGSTGSGLKVFMVSGNMGVPEAWARALTKGEPLGAGEPSEKEIEAVAARAQAKSGGKGASKKKQQTEIKVTFAVCDSGSSEPVSKKRIDRQVDVLNEAFKGRDECKKKLYNYPAVNTKVSFKRVGEVRKFTDSRCGSCYQNFEKLVKKYTKRVDGKIRILICDDDSGVLGAASFPWYGSRGIFVQGGTLPGGALKPYNQGDTLTHELGHYLGLPHTFSNGCSPPGDEAGDTNDEESARFGKPPTQPHSCGSGDPVHNFMDYTDDGWMCSFTADQSANIWKYLDSFNSDLV